MQKWGDLPLLFLLEQELFRSRHKSALQTQQVQHKTKKEIFFVFVFVCLFVCFFGFTNLFWWKFFRTCWWRYQLRSTRLEFRVSDAAGNQIRLCRTGVGKFSFFFFVWFVWRLLTGFLSFQGTCQKAKELGSRVCSCRHCNWNHDHQWKIYEAWRAKCRSDWEAWCRG